MSKIVQIGFKLRVAPGRYRQLSASLAHELAGAPGLRWMLWLLNEEVAYGGAVCLFDDEPARDLFLARELAARIGGAPFHQGPEVKLFDPLAVASALTRPPLRDVEQAEAPLV